MSVYGSNRIAKMLVNKAGNKVELGIKGNMQTSLYTLEQIIDMQPNNLESAIYVKCEDATWLVDYSHLLYHIIIAFGLRCPNSVQHRITTLTLLV